jgi:pSer/pThr/pTyr-binding forkhead associated (FHA) protein
MTAEGTLLVADTGSTNGTYLNGDASLMASRD